MKVTVTGLDKLASLRGAIKDFPLKAQMKVMETWQANQETILSRGRETIKTHVYEEYDPTEYERSNNLQKALSFMTEGNSIIAYISGQYLLSAPNAMKEKKKIKPFDYQWSVDRGFGWFWGDDAWSGPRPYAYYLRGEIVNVARQLAQIAVQKAAQEMVRGGK
jgi:hypothetical protein